MGVGVCVCGGWGGGAWNWTRIYVTGISEGDFHGQRLRCCMTPCHAVVVFLVIFSAGCCFLLAE